MGWPLELQLQVAAPPAGPMVKHRCPVWHNSSLRKNRVKSDFFSPTTKAKSLVYSVQVELSLNIFIVHALKLPGRSVYFKTTSKLPQYPVFSILDCFPQLSMGKRIPCSDLPFQKLSVMQYFTTFNSETSIENFIILNLAATDPRSVTFLLLW